MNAIKIKFFDASAVVGMLCPEEIGSSECKKLFNNSVVFTSWILLAEAMGVLKRKWKKKEISELQYDQRMHYLFALIRESRFLIHDIELQNNKPRLKTYEYDLLDLRKKYPNLDAADVLQLIAIREGILGKLIGGSRPHLVTADCGLRDAAKNEGIEVIFIDSA